MAPWVAGAIVLVVWEGVLFARVGEPFGQPPEAWVVYEQVTAALNLTIQAVAGLIAGALALRRGARLRRSVLTGALLALVPAAFAGVHAWTSKPSIIILVPSGPRAAPLFAVIAFVSSALPCAGGAAVGWGVARRLFARHSS
jgi:hypothetical protein